MYAKVYLWEARDFSRVRLHMFVVDAFIGNTDRHNGNWGILANNETGTVRIVSIYDCGAALLPLIGEVVNYFKKETQIVRDEYER